MPVATIEDEIQIMRTMLILAFLFIPSPIGRRGWHLDQSGVWTNGPFKVLKGGDDYWRAHCRSQVGGGWLKAEDAMKDADYWIELSRRRTKVGCDCPGKVIGVGTCCCPTPTSEICECPEETRAILRGRGNE